MRTTLNSFILELFKGKNPEIKLNAWRDELAAEKQAQTEREEKYRYTYQHPREEFEEAERVYLEKYKALRKAYENSTDITRKNALQEWLSHPIPPILYQSKPVSYSIL